MPDGHRKTSVPTTHNRPFQCMLLRSHEGLARDMHAEEIVKALQALQQCMKGEYRSDQHECEDAEWSEEVTFEEGAL